MTSPKPLHLEALERLKAAVAYFDGLDPAIQQLSGQISISADYLRSLLSSYEAQGERLREVEGALGWRHMDSAPRDGRLILLAFGSDHTSTGAYHRNEDDPYPWKFIDTQGEGLPIFNGARDDKYGPTGWMEHPKWGAALTQPPAMENGE